MNLFDKLITTLMVLSFLGIFVSVFFTEDKEMMKYTFALFLLFYNIFGAVSGYLDKKYVEKEKR